jgi:8-amino-7-oxononanoate synthase
MDKFASALKKMKAGRRLRRLSPATGLDFTSNDYLGMKSHPALRQAAIEALEGGMDLGAGGSRLLRGNHPAHEALEAYTARAFGFPAALFFSSGFLANYALMTTLPARQDVILFDSLIHASLRDGAQASPAAHARIPHNDLSAFEDALRRPRRKDARCWVVAESVYSMDGDIAPAAELLRLCQKHEAWLVLDEAHGTGVFGPTGHGVAEGLAPTDRVITVHTCGKALGAAGALVCASAEIRDYLVARARPFIYSTAPMPLQALLVHKALELAAAEPWRRERLWKLCALAGERWPIAAPRSPIIPVVLGEDAKALTAAARLREQGFDVRAIRPPTVPEGTARLRLTLNALLRDEDVIALGEALNSLFV